MIDAERLPRTLYIDEAVEDHPAVTSILGKLPTVPVKIVRGEKHPGGGWLLTKNRGRFLKPCPGQKGSICCHYWVLEWALGCPFSCEYCALQAYLPSGDLILNVNLEDACEELAALRKRVRGPIRLGTGEFGDSLALEGIFPHAERVIEWAADMQPMIVEIKSKSDNVETLRDIRRRSHVIVGFSLNPDTFVERFEHGAASLDARLAAVEQVLAWGYRVSIHFDPLLLVEGWEEGYRGVVERLGSILPASRLAWISLGSFRYPPGMAEMIGRSFPESDLFKVEFARSRDGKWRYLRPERERLYAHLLRSLTAHYPVESIYFCMETPVIWRRLMHLHGTSKRLKERLDERV